MGAGNSAFNFNFAAQQQYPVAPQPTLNGGMQPYSAAPGAVDQMGQQLPTLNGSAQAYMPMAYYAQPQKYGYPANGMEFGHQQPISNGSMQPFFTAENAPAQEYAYPAAAYTAPLNGAMGQNGQRAATAAPKRAARGAAARPREEGAANGSRKRARTGPARRDSALAGPAGAQAPAVQPAAAQEGKYARTKAGVYNKNANRPGNQQGQTAGWKQSKCHHHRNCKLFEFDGCLPNCELRLRWPETFEDWHRRRFMIRWEPAVHDGRLPQQIVSGIFVDAKEKNEMPFKVLGLYDPATGAVDKSIKTVHRVDKEMFMG